MYEESSQAEIVSFPVYRILFCAVGPAGSDEEQCFGFTCSRGEAQETAIFQCHVFKCTAARAVSLTEPPPLPLTICRCAWRGLCRVSVRVWGGGEGGGIGPPREGSIIYRWRYRPVPPPPPSIDAKGSTAADREFQERV